MVVGRLCIIDITLLSVHVCLPFYDINKNIFLQCYMYSMLYVSYMYSYIYEVGEIGLPVR